MRFIGRSVCASSESSLIGAMSYAPASVASKCPLSHTGHTDTGTANFPFFLSRDSAKAKAKSQDTSHWQKVKSKRLAQAQGKEQLFLAMGDDGCTATGI